MDAKTRKNRKNLLSSGLFLSVVSLLAVGGTWFASSRVNSTAQWPSTTGKIVSSKAVNSATKTGRLAVISKIAEIKYQYTLDGQTLEGNRLRVIPILHTETEAAEVTVASYPLGSQVPVFYDPANPKDALLQPIPGKDASELLTMIKLGGWAGVAVSLLLLGMGTYAPNGIMNSSGVRTNSPPTVHANRRPWHPVLRYFIMGIGGFICLLGLLLTVSFATSEHHYALATEVISGIVMVGIAASGAYLVRLAISRGSVMHSPQQ